VAAIAHPKVEQFTAQTHTGDLNWVDLAQIDAGDFVNDGVYLILASAHVGGSDFNDTFTFRLLHGATTFPGSDMVLEPWGQATDLRSYFYMTKFTQPATAELVKLQFAVLNDTANTAYADTIQIYTIRLDADLTENTDFFYNEDDDTGGVTALTTSFVEFANVVFTPGTADEDWLVIGSCSWDVNSTDTNTLAHIRKGTNPAAPDDDAPQISLEGEDTAERKVKGFHRVFPALPASSVEFAVDMRDDSATVVDDHVRSAVFAIRLDAFEDHAQFWNEAPVILSTDPGTEIGNLDPTPTIPLIILDTGIGAACKHVAPASIGRTHARA